jgi:hypothetical protein
VLGVQPPRFPSSHNDEVKSDPVAPHPTFANAKATFSREREKV